MSEIRRETSLEELLQLVTRLTANEPSVRCRVGNGPLAPLAEALNVLAAELDARRSSRVEEFGMRALIDQSPNLMVACDMEERIRFLNFNVPGMRVEESLGRSVFDFVQPEEHERVRGIIKKVLQTGEADGYEIRSVVAPGSPWFMVRVGPVRSNGRTVGFTMILTDVTKLKETQMRLEQSNRELESFAAAAAHDLQEPLRKIQSFGERLKNASSSLGPEERDYLSRMMNAATRMRSLIDDLLSFARITTKARPFSRVELASVLRDVLSDLEVNIEQTGATITVGELPTLEADPTQMRQLLMNLLANALKFRREGVAPRIAIEASEDTRSGCIQLRVRDNGIGFNEKYVDRIFNAFQRLHGLGKYPGTGMGLAICRKIAERHGGTIQAQSSPGNGAAFTVTLPLTQPRRA